MNSSDNGNTKILWWLMGIVAFILTALIGGAYQNLRSDVSDLRANGVTRREHLGLENLVTEMRQTQINRNERGAIVDSIVSDIRNDLAGIKSELKDVREFLFRQYGGMPQQKPVPPTSDY
jgi:hypothetical protein